MSPGARLLELLQRLDGHEGAALAFVAVIAFLEYVAPPVPGDLGVTLGAALAFARGWFVPWFFLAALGGSALGSAVTWRFGAWLERRSRTPMHPRIAQLHDGALAATKSLDRHGVGLIVVCRFMPAVRAFVVVAAGFRAMPFARVMAAATLGAALWNALLFTLAALVGRNLHALAGWLDVYNRVAGVVLLVLVAALGLRAWWQRRAAPRDGERRFE